MRAGVTVSARRVSSFKTRGPAPLVWVMLVLLACRPTSGGRGPARTRWSSRGLERLAGPHASRRSLARLVHRRGGQLEGRQETPAAAARIQRKHAAVPEQVRRVTGRVLGERLGQAAGTGVAHHHALARVVLEKARLAGPDEGARRLDLLRMGKGTLRADRQRAVEVDAMFVLVSSAHAMGRATSSRDQCHPGNVKRRQRPGFAGSVDAKTCDGIRPRGVASRAWARCGPGQTTCDYSARCTATGAGGRVRRYSAGRG